MTTYTLPMLSRFFLLLVALSSSCLCAAPPQGECSGTWGGMTFDQAPLDKASKVVITRKTTCAGNDLKRYQLFWSQSKLKLDFSYQYPGPAILLPITIAFPKQANPLLSFELTPQPEATSGELKLSITGLEGRRTGTLALNAPAESLSCTFDVPYEVEGASISCGSGGGGFDFD